MDPDSVLLQPVDYDPFGHGDYAAQLMMMAHANDLAQAQAPQWSQNFAPQAIGSVGQDEPTFQESFDAAKRAQQEYDARLGALPAIGDLANMDHRGYYDDRQTNRDHTRAQREFPTATYGRLKKLEREMEEEQKDADENEDENLPWPRPLEGGA